jgi:hypothetical protein
MTIAISAGKSRDSIASMTACSVVPAPDASTPIRNDFGIVAA